MPFTAIGCTEPNCPYCSAALEKMPGRKKKCPSCTRDILVRTRPLDRKRVLVTDSQAEDLEEQWEEWRERRGDPAPEEDRCLELLKRGAIQQAAALTPAEEDAVARCREIARVRPGILKDLPAGSWPHVRAAAQMMELLGTNSARKWIPAGVPSSPRFNIDVAARMLLFAVVQRERVELFRRMARSRFRVSVIGDDRSCPACFALANQVFGPNDLPEVPHPACTSPMGCRCSVLGER